MLVDEFKFKKTNSKRLENTNLNLVLLYNLYKEKNC